MANSVTARFNDDCKVHVAMSDDTTVTKAVIIDADGNETDIGGGGGSSDFSIAEVTLIGKDGSLAGNVYLPIVQDAVVEEEIPDMAYIIANFIANETHIYKAIMYKGAVTGLIDNAVGHPVENITGDAVEMGNGYLLITGDCTITIA